MLENVRLAVQARAGVGLHFLGMAAARTDLADRALSWLDRVRLAHRARSAAAALNHGDQRKLEVAILLAMEPEIFMFDEPTAGHERGRGARGARPDRGDQARRRDNTILLVEHKMEVVRRLADRVIVLHNGALVADGEPGEVVASPIVQEAYLGVRPGARCLSRRRC